MANTKRALLTSVLAIVACVAMLIGSTFAWFTDTASTGVNKKHQCVRRYLQAVRLHPLCGDRR